MSHWDELERKLQQQRDEEARKLAKELEKESQKINKKMQRANQEYEQLLAEHKRRFKCHICKEPSEGPGEGRVIGSHYVDNGYDPENDYYVDVHATDWNKPTGLMKCGVCGYWTCSKDLRHYPEGNICDRDAKDGYLPGQKRGWFR